MKQAAGSLKKRYARALFELCKESQGVKEFFVQIDCLTQVIGEDAYDFFSSPVISAQMKYEVLTYISEKAGISELLLSFLKTLVFYDRFSLLTGIFEEFKKEADTHMNVMRVEVFSAQELDAAEQEELSLSIEKTLHSKIILNSSLKESLLAGFVLRFEDRSIDASLKQRLEILKHDLLMS